MITGGQEVITTYRQVFKLSEFPSDYRELQVFIHRMRESYLRSYNLDAAGTIPRDAITVTIKDGALVASYLLREESK